MHQLYEQGLSRKAKGSNNRNKQRIIVARIHEKIANIRKDYLNKVSTQAWVAPSPKGRPLT
ncbi:MAG: transposase [Selenomonadaceae bacterium]|nr:transposase [Selenomonadaceae bacterium]